VSQRPDDGHRGDDDGHDTDGCGADKQPDHDVEHERQPTERGERSTYRCGKTSLAAREGSRSDGDKGARHVHAKFR
jgi:hypothetical protein